MRICISLILAMSHACLVAEPIVVRQTQGATRGFLVIRSEEGKIIARGELNQVAHGERITTHLLYRFTDGSVDEDTVLYTQRGTFRLISDHHTQRGPYFPKPIDYLVDATTGTITSRSLDKDGKEKIEVEHTTIPPDTYNGLVGTILVNSAPNASEFQIGMVAPTGKGRLIKLSIEPAGRGTVSIVGLAHTANIFRVKVELGGVAGVVAPIIGKKPADTMVWVLPGAAPGLVRQIGQLYNEGPIVSIEISGTSFQHSDRRAP